MVSSTSFHLPHRIDDLPFCVLALAHLRSPFFRPETVHPFRTQQRVQVNLGGGLLPRHENLEYCMRIRQYFAPLEERLPELEPVSNVPRRPSHTGESSDRLAGERSFESDSKPNASIGRWIRIGVTSPEQPGLWLRNGAVRELVTVTAMRRSHSIRRLRSAWAIGRRNNSMSSERRERFLVGLWELSSFFYCYYSTEANK